MDCTFGFPGDFFPALCLLTALPPWCRAAAHKSPGGVTATLFWAQPRFLVGEFSCPIKCFLSIPPLLLLTNVLIAPHSITDFPPFVQAGFKGRSIGPPQLGIKNFFKAPSLVWGFEEGES